MVSLWISMIDLNRQDCYTLVSLEEGGAMQETAMRILLSVLTAVACAWVGGLRKCRSWLWSTWLSRFE